MPAPTLAEIDDDVFWNDVNIKVMYRRNLHSLVMKYGLHKGGLPWNTTSPES